jgi:S-adenosylmethionine:tRNA ribosyltransferase-isomerase
MKTSEFDYELPAELIAQEPIEPRDASRMMVLHRGSQAIEHRTFRDLPRYLQSGDVVIVNRSRVIPARLLAQKVPSGGRVELLLLRHLGDHLGCQEWEALARGRRIRPGMNLQLVTAEGQVVGEVQVLKQDPETGTWQIRLAGVREEDLAAVGQVPLPPYIRKPLKDPERYQTVYASVPGSAAAPTAGLHITPEILRALQDQGVEVWPVTLHIGLDTFRPVRTEDVSQHVMHAEWCELPEETADAINRAKVQGRRVVAVGTTVVRTLETAAQEAARTGANTVVGPFAGETRLFITPGYAFRVVDVLLTNFHLPRSTLLMLVCAFAGRDFVLRAYREAISQRYRFYSFGDCMLIL